LRYAAFLYREIQQHYLHSSRELQRLSTSSLLASIDNQNSASFGIDSAFIICFFFFKDSVSRSPIYALFSETLSGLSTIRAYSKQQHFTLENERKVDNNQKAYFLSTTANRWLGLRLEFVGNSVVFGAAFFTVMGRDTVRKRVF
jgi:ABC-type multidrug transport system fused ATPase/permease subunit